MAETGTMRHRFPAPGPRKESLVSLVPPCGLGLEVGADHGIISAYLLACGACARMIISDISVASLDKAKRLFAFHGLEATFRVADGLNALHEPVEAVVIAGMGGQTMVDILSRGRERLHGALLVLQANTDIPEVRRWIMNNGYRIDAERLIREGRRFYVAMRAVVGHAAYTDKELWLGPCLLADRPPLWQPYLAWRQGCLKRIQGEKEPMLAWVEEELKAL